jgi:site-specific DNA-methyltransferase (adenine-specific)
MDAADYEQLSKGVNQIRQRGGVMDNSWKNSSDLSGANPANPLGRWPANFIHDGSQEVLDLFPNTQPSRSGGISYNKDTQHLNGKQPHARTGHDDLGGSTARYFYCAKANKTDRNEGLDDFEEKQYSHDGRQARNETAFQRNDSVAANHHPTVKPTDLMRYLCRLVTQPGGTVLDPFMGSGTTGKAAMLDGFDFIGCEMDEQYYKIAEARIRHALER